MTARSTATHRTSRMFWTKKRPLTAAASLAFLGMAALSNDSSLNTPRRLLRSASGDDSSPPPSDDSDRPRGKVCSVGRMPEGWTDEDLLSDVGPFLAALKERDEHFGAEEANFGGNGMFHSFVLWAVLRRVRPSVIVESGVWHGRTSFLIRKATESWSPKFVRLDPATRVPFRDRVPWNGRDGVPGNTGEIYDFLGADFVDFAKVKWSDITDDLSSAMVFFDDHMDQARRLREAHAAGFGHALFDDNFIAGVGDVFSLKNACEDDANGESGSVRTFFSATPQRCDFMHHACTDLSPTDAAAARTDMMERIDQYWEGPPLAPIDGVAYGSIKQMVFGGIYEGPQQHVWADKHDSIIVEASKEPLFKDFAEAEEQLGVPQDKLRYEAARYLNIAYVKIKQKESKAIKASVKKII